MLAHHATPKYYQCTGHHNISSIVRRSLRTRHFPAQVSAQRSGAASLAFPTTSSYDDPLAGRKSVEGTSQESTRHGLEPTGKRQGTALVLDSKHHRLEELGVGVPEVSDADLG